MRVSDKPELKGIELFTYLKANKQEIIKVKKSMPIKSEAFAAEVSTEVIEDQVNKQTGGELPKGVISVKVVANTAMVLDSHMDVLGVDCWKKTISENGPKGKNIIAHIHDHDHTVMAKVGIVKDIYSEFITTSRLGFNSSVKKAQSLIFKTDVLRSFNNKVYNLYDIGEIKQHSIGMQYVKITLALNAEQPEFEEEKKEWDNHFNDIVNKEQAEERGYFWYVSEIKLYENSAVLFGSNPATPTLEVAKNEEEPKEEPEKDPQNTEQQEETKNKNFNISAFL